MIRYGTLDSRITEKLLPVIVALFGLPSAASPALAQSRSLSTVWTIEPTTAIREEANYAGGDYLLKQRLIPSGLVRINSEFSSTDLKADARSGTQFFEVQADHALVYCDARKPLKKANSATYLCLVDANRDGQFEAAFKGLSDTAGIPTIGGKMPKQPVQIQPISYTALDPSTFGDTYFVGIQRRNFFNIYGRESFMIQFGSNNYSQEITAPVQFKSSELPKDMTILGARFTAISETAGKMRIKIHASMPRQAFGLVRTVTYRY